MNQKLIEETITELRDQYKPAVWDSTYPNGMNGPELSRQLSGLSSAHLEYGLEQNRRKHAGWPPGVSEFANLCKGYISAASGESKCSIENCPVSVNSSRCEFHPYTTPEDRLSRITDALHKHIDMVRYYLFISNQYPADTSKRYLIISLHNPQDYDEWTPDLLKVWETFKPETDEAPHAYQLRVKSEVCRLIDAEVY